ncbi:MAG TPA: hypothetical protein VM915_07350 [Verrucomicrobiae bacterium]|jgi:hypothetical protein|nr:hypothetical protein [Verrucomicrobiae bacterium]
MSRLRIQVHHPKHCGGWANPPTYAPRSGGYSSVRNLQATLLWRWRSRTRIPPGTHGAMRIDKIERGLSIHEREEVAAYTRTDVTLET